MAAISKITIDGFKAFPDNFPLELEGKNLLMYGENGSGKSSIYYALHSLLQSQCKDKNDKYFDPNHAESIVNQHTKKPNAKVEVQFAGSGVTYSISHAGYHESVVQPISPLRDLNGQCVFINHKFLFNVFSFRNSQYIDLFPVFIKDILPFTLTQDKSEYISNIYDDVIKEIKRHGRSNKIEDSYQARIDKFNSETKYVIEQINTNAVKTATIIYNEFFRNAEDRQLKITLGYDNNRDKVPQANKSYWLRCGYRYLYVEKAGVRQEKSVSSSMEILQPAITLKVEELQDDGVSYRVIEKPQTYFNEAKLTAIALSIRFALLDTVTAANGRFLALDDMLISLDMSNRTKIIYYLLDVVSDKYNIYLFTHDRTFFELIKEVISAKNLKTDWLYKEIYNSDIASENPKCYESEDSFTRAMYHFKNFDYPASANYLRKTVEELMLLFPPYISKNDNGTDKEKLRAKIDSAKNVLECTDGDIADIQRIIFSLGTLLNPLSHRSIDTNIYRTELDAVMDIIPRLRQHILDLDIKEVVALENDVILFMEETDNKKCEIRVRLRTPLYSYLDQDGTKKLSIAKGKTMESVTIKNGIREAPKPFKYFPNATLEEICKKLHEHLHKAYTGNYQDFYKDKDGNSFNTLL